MSEYNPDKWVIVKIKCEKNGSFYKILGDWSGGYLDSNSWRLSSPVESVTKEGDYIMFNNYSGSVYKCHKNMMTLGVMSSGIYSQMEEEASKNDDLEVSMLTLEELEEELK